MENILAVYNDTPQMAIDSGYKMITTYWGDFSVADKFGIDAIEDTYNRAMAEAKDLGVEYLTELVMVLNWKIWQLHDNRRELAKVYNHLWIEADNWCLDNLKDNDLKYYLKTTY